MKIAALIRENARNLAKLIHWTTAGLHNGRPSCLPRRSENFEWAAYNARSLMGHTLPANPNELAYLQREPVGVVAIITPWNVPLRMVVEKLAPALTVGNTCIVKPPSIDALEALKLAELLDTLGLPPGTINFITGPGGPVGGALSSHRGVDMVAFTGSSEVGKEIMATASGTVKRLQLELGGKNPVIILEDADINAAAAETMTAQYKNCGQICASPGRFYVHEKVYDEFLEKFISGAKKFVVGDPTDMKTQMGPLVSAEHCEQQWKAISNQPSMKALKWFSAEKDQPPPHEQGLLGHTDIFTDVTQKMKVAREEIFGPVACFMEKFNSDEQVIA